jgi:hypothetical protein
MIPDTPRPRRSHVPPLNLYVVPHSRTPLAGAPVETAEPAEYGYHCCYLAICLNFPNRLVDESICLRVCVQFPA